MKISTRISTDQSHGFRRIRIDPCKSVLEIRQIRGYRFLFVPPLAGLAFALAFAFPACTFNWFLTLLTPSTAFATVSAFVFWAALATVPLSVTISLSTSTLIVESRRSSAAARSKRVLIQSQVSFAPVPTLRPDSFASRLYRSLFASYSERVGALLLFVLATGVGVGVAVAIAFAFQLAVAFEFAVLSQPGSSTASAAKAMNPVILRLINLLLTSEHTQSKFGKHTLVERASKRRAEVRQGDRIGKI